MKRLLGRSHFLLWTAFRRKPVSSGDQILNRIESENGRRHDLLKRWSGSRRYTLQNARFGKEAAGDIEMKYRDPDGESFLVMT
jgi:hypothetical protein